MSVVKKFRRGYTLITTMLVMIVLFVIGIAGAMLVYYGNMTSGAMINYSKAYYNADYGLQQVAYNAMNGACSCANNDCGMFQKLPTGGTVQVITQSDTNNKTCFIESIGTGQTGGQVVRAIAISTGSSNWGALGVIGGSVSIGGSPAINGCDYINQCEATGLLKGSNLTLNGNLNSYTCQSNPHPNNPQGIVGNPYTKTTTSTDVAQLITNFNSFSQLQSYLQNQVANYFGATANSDGSIGTPTQNPSCYCNNSAMTSSSGITCGTTAMPNSCSYYYIGGSLSIGSASFENNQIIYADGGINITGNTLSISGGLLYTPNLLTIDTHGNTQIGGYTQPTTLIASNASIDMHGTSSINGLLMINNLSDFSIGNSSVNGALYVNNASDGINLSGNTSINFNYAILQTITSAFPNLFNPINCYSQGPQQVMLNAETLY
jgi:type II secretory pathway pseudopilin PulG